METAIIFLVALTALVFVHELGHFLAARYFGVRVDEFAIGFPPRLFGVKRGGTDYVLNLLPIGGYVKIFGEDPQEEIKPGEETVNFSHKPRYAQAVILLAGVTMNLIFAYLLLVGALWAGLPQLAEEGEAGEVLVTEVLADSPAALAGLKEGDIVRVVAEGTASIVPVYVEEVQEFIGTREGRKVSLTILRKEVEENITLTPVAGITETGAAVGIGLAVIESREGIFWRAPIAAISMTWDMTKRIVLGFGYFLKQTFVGESGLSALTGPIGIATLVGNAADVGLPYLLSFVAFISLNLAVINAFPFPALDGGRLLFVGIEALIRRPLPAKVLTYTNGLGFVLLILLMVAITWQDLVRVFS